MPNLLGIEIGGTKLQLGLGRGDGSISRLVRRDVLPAGGAEGVRAQIVEAFRSLDARVDAVGVGFGGPVDADRGIVTTSNQVDGWAGFPLRDWLRETLGVDRVVVQNDADTAALGEARFGAGRGLSPILYVNSGSGIGGGLIVDGKIYRGSGVGAIEIGHVIVCEGAMRPTRQPPLTLEQVASGWAIGEKGRQCARLENLPNWGEPPEGSPLHPFDDPGSLIRLCGGDPERVDAKMVAESARLGQLDGRTVLRGPIHAMGAALANAITLLAPRRVILGGGVSLMGDDLWLDPIREVVEARVFPSFRGTFDMTRAELGEDVVVHGALALAADAVGPS